MAVTYMLFLKRKKGLTKAQFRAHYESSHVALAKKHFGHLFQDYRRYYPEDTIDFRPGGQSSSVGDDGYDAISKVEFKDRADYEEYCRINALPHVRAELRPDGLLFVDVDNIRVSVCEEVRTWSAADVVKSA
jgi:hypothetical protein